MAAPQYATRDTLKLALNITDSSRDSLVDIALAAAARAIYRRTGKRRFDKDPAPTTRILDVRGRQVWDRRLCAYRLMTPDIATAAGIEIKSEDGTASYLVKPVYPDSPDEPIQGLIGTFPDRIALTAQFGWPEVPDDIIQAHLLQAMRYYRRKDSPEGIAGSAEWGLVRVPRVDPDVEEMIQDYCYPAVG